MGFVTGLCTFLIIWWVMIFTVLPIGAGANPEHETGHDAGAPKRPNLKKKFIINTVITSILWVVVYVLVEFDLVPLREWLQLGT